MNLFISLTFKHTFHLIYTFLGKSFPSDFSCEQAGPNLSLQCFSSVEYMYCHTPYNQYFSPVDNRHLSNAIIKFHILQSY